MWWWPACAPRSADLTNQLERELVALNQVNSRLRTEVLHCGASAPPDSIARTLKQVLADTEAEVFTVGAETVVVLPVGYIFTDPYIPNVREEARPAVDLLASVLRDHEGYTVTVVGHANPTLPADVAVLYASPTDLSFQYAWAMVEALSSDYGVPADLFTVSARGPWDPLAPEDSASGPYRNRRVEVVIYPPGHH